VVVGKCPDKLGAGDGTQYMGMVPYVFSLSPCPLSLCPLSWGSTPTRLFVIGSRINSWSVVPIGRSLTDGMNYPVNPRHDPDGRWRPRSQWPEELR
jgi:hypothetical protein